MSEAGVLRFKDAGTSTRRRNLGEQLLDKTGRLVFPEVFEAGGRHSMHDSHHTFDMSRGKILNCHAFGTNFPGQTNRG